MRSTKKKLQVEQLEKKMDTLKNIALLEIPPKGWIFTIRDSLNISLRQLGNKLNITPQSVKEIEEREESKSITLKNMTEVAEALDMKLVYGFIPKDGSLQNLIEKKASALASQIVLRTSNNMSLENQENMPERINKAIEEKKAQLINELPRFLWD